MHKCELAVQRGETTSVLSAHGRAYFRLSSASFAVLYGEPPAVLYELINILKI